MFGVNVARIAAGVEYGCLDHGMDPERQVRCPVVPRRATSFVITSWRLRPCSLSGRGSVCRFDATGLADFDCSWAWECAMCGDGILSGFEQCEPPDGVTCDASCQLIGLP
jgi:hypothetical protein